MTRGKPLLYWCILYKFPNLIFVDVAEITSSMLYFNNTKPIIKQSIYPAISSTSNKVSNKEVHYILAQSNRFLLYRCNINHKNDRTYS